jgi:hypothetical protein
MPESTPATPATPAVPATPPASAAPVVSAKPTVMPEETWDVLENGQTLKKTRKEIIEAYQLRQLSDKKRSEADKVLQEYNQLFKVYKEDPIKFMRATGIDFDNLATSYLSKKAEDAMLDPKELELRKAKAEAEEYKKYVEEQKANAQKLASEAAIGREREKIHGEIVQAIEEAKDLGLPVDEELVIAIAQKMILQDKAQKPLSAKEALPKAYQSTQKWLQGMAAKMEGEALVKWLGQETAMKIRKYDLGQLKAKRQAAAPAQPQSLVKPPVEKKTPAKPYKTWSQFKAESLDTLK